MKTAKSTFLAALLFATGALGVPSAVSQEAAVLPGGATSLQETHEDWQISCQIANGAKQCAVLQQQYQQGGQRILAIEVQSQSEGGIKGVAVLPFGLKLQEGVAFQIDDEPALPAAHFSTCLPAGCILPVEFDAAALKTLRSGSTLRLKVTSTDEKELTFSVSLKGFSSALDRHADL
ncbi:invasion associated locus B family protein [Aquamicrobium defluvii]|uniref:Invasion protein n=1 Tax=Aquamicrobium defluvii TaxID=69279 RepID=A0A011UT53_9HYPH|nr:invasion associated locus B family protein [Aquamicrobium defluvii]EXL09411.1 invasion protein [Aquamicrobium defluvii]EZQ12649.1 invasion protein [Halopseudomonas bauzanensis]TDR36253.1 invasion protein IalB [Aquamicrobium defluvii]